MLALPPPSARLVAGRPPLSIARRVVAVVGDYVASLLFDMGVLPRLLVMDCRTLRSSYSRCPAVEELKLMGYSIVRASNPPGGLTLDAAAAVWRSLRYGEALSRTAVVVDGEEDLLALVALLSAPYGGLVAYGFPRLASVYVKSERAVRIIVRDVIRGMECAS